MKYFILLTCTIIMHTVAGAQNEKNCCDPFPKTIKVSGSAEMEFTPDEIYVEVYLREYKKKGEDKKELAKIKEEFINLCHSLSIADSNIVVSDYEGFNNYFYFKRSKKQDPDLYAAVRYVIKFKDLIKLNSLADKLDDEAVQRFEIASVTHSRIQEYRRKLKIEAVKAAKDKAIYLTEAVNEKLGEAITIVEPGEYQNNINYRSNVVENFAVSQKRLSAGMDNAIDNINYKKIKLRYEVEVLFALK